MNVFRHFFFSSSKVIKGNLINEQAEQAAVFDFFFWGVMNLVNYLDFIFLVFFIVTFSKNEHKNKKLIPLLMLLFWFWLKLLFFTLINNR